MADKNTINDLEKTEKGEMIKKKYHDALNSKISETKKLFKESYEVFNEETWNWIISLIKRIQNDSWEQLIDLNVPDIYIDPEDGSFNCYWKNDLLKLLLDISPNLNETIHIFGKKVVPPHMEHEVRTQPKIAYNSIMDWLKLIYYEQ